MYFQILYTRRKEKKTLKSNKNAVTFVSRFNPVACPEQAGFHYVEYALFSGEGYNRMQENQITMLCFA